MNMIEVRYPEIQVELSGHNGNAFSILKRVCDALGRGGVESEEIEEFLAEATSDNYDHLLQTCMKWCDIT